MATEPGHGWRESRDEDKAPVATGDEPTEPAAPELDWPPDPWSSAARVYGMPATP